MRGPLPGMSQSGGGLRTADGRPIDLAISQDSGRALTDVLKAGQVVSGRVIEAFDHQTYLFSLRGRNLIAQSAAPLVRDSVVQFQVVGLGEGISLRMLATAPADQASTSSAAARLQSLGIPVDAAALRSLAAFEDAGAPLDRQRLLTASAALRALGDNPPPAALTRVASAHAALAQAGIPATPITLAVAERAITGANANTSQALANLRQAVAQLPQPSQQAPALGTAPSAHSPGPTSQAAPTPAAAAPTPAGTPSPAPTTAPTSTTAQQAAPAQLPLVGTPTTSATTPPTWQPGTPLPSALPDLADGAAAARSALRQAGLHPPNEAPLAHQTAANGLATPEANAAGGAGASQVSHPDHEPTLLRELAQMAMRLQIGGDQTAAALGRAAVRDAVADSLVPPKHLQDYQWVLPLALSERGNPLPARLAVTRQRQRDGREATYVRIDTELSHTGPVSIRLAGLPGLPAAITILASPQALSAFSTDRNSLENDLAESGIEAHVRVEPLEGVSDA